MLSVEEVDFQDQLLVFLDMSALTASKTSG